MSSWLQKVLEGEKLPITNFLRARKKGAAKIAAEARDKGGPAEFTAMHFEAKAEPYSTAITAAIEGEGIESIEKQAQAALEELQDWKNISMEEFQKLTGKFEALGESFLAAKHPDALK